MEELRCRSPEHLTRTEPDLTAIVQTVGIAKFVAPKTGAKVGVFDVCRDTDGNVHLRINDTRNEVVMTLTWEQTRRVESILASATSFSQLREGCGG